MAFVLKQAKNLYLYNFKLQLKYYSSTHLGVSYSLVEAITTTKNGKAFIAWHPQKDFPYELSKPIPVTMERNQSDVIKESSINTAMQAFKNKHPEIARQELMKITHTTKHRWYPRDRDRKAKKTEMDREYL